MTISVALQRIVCPHHTKLWHFWMAGFFVGAVGFVGETAGFAGAGVAAMHVEALMHCPLDLLL